LSIPRKKKETFWADEPIMEKLATIPEGEKSFVIRMALRQYFGITSCKPPEPITRDTAQLVARELISNLRANSKAN